MSRPGTESNDPYIASFEAMSRVIHTQTTPDAFEKDEIALIQAAFRKPSNQSFEAVATGCWTIDGSSFPELSESSDSVVPLADRGYVPLSDAIKLSSMVMSVASSLDLIHHKTLKRGAPPVTANLLTARIGERIAYDYVASEYDKLDRVRHTSAHISKAAAQMLHRPDGAWQSNKLSVFSRSINTATCFMQTIDRYAYIDDIETESLTRQNDQLFAQTAMLQKYGVKPVIMPSLDAEGSMREWHVQSALDLRQSLKTTLGADYKVGADSIAPNSIAFFFGTNGTFNSSHTEQVFEKSKVRSKTAYTAVRFDISWDIPVKDQLTISFGLTKDGHLETLQGMNLRDFCAGTNAMHAYEQLRAEVLSLYFDNVTPVYVKHLVDMETEQPVENTATPPKAERAQSSPGMRRLIMARHRVMTTIGDDITEALDAEIAEAESRTVELAKHPVINHIRFIDPTYRASKEARELCFKETGIELAEFGETYVRRHNRGTREEEAKGHRASVTAGIVSVGSAVGLKPVAAQPFRRSRKGGRYTPPKNR